MNYQLIRMLILLLLVPITSPASAEEIITFRDAPAAVSGFALSQEAQQAERRRFVTIDTKAIDANLQKAMETDKRVVIKIFSNLTIRARIVGKSKGPIGGVFYEIESDKGSGTYDTIQVSRGGVSVMLTHEDKFIFISTKSNGGGVIYQIDQYDVPMDDSPGVDSE